MIASFHLRMTSYYFQMTWHYYWTTLIHCFRMMTLCHHFQKTLTHCFYSVVSFVAAFPGCLPASVAGWCFPVVPAASGPVAPLGVLPVRVCSAAGGHCVAVLPPETYPFPVWEVGADGLCDGCYSSMYLHNRDRRDNSYKSTGT